MPSFIRPMTSRLRALSNCTFSALHAVVPTVKATHQRCLPQGEGPCDHRLVSSPTSGTASTNKDRTIVPFWASSPISYFRQGHELHAVVSEGMNRMARTKKQEQKRPLGTKIWISAALLGVLPLLTLGIVTSFASSSGSRRIVEIDELENTISSLKGVTPLRGT